MSGVSLRQRAASTCKQEEEAGPPGFCLSLGQFPLSGCLGRGAGGRGEAANQLSPSSTLSLFSLERAWLMPGLTSPAFLLPWDCPHAWLPWDLCARCPLC